MLSPQRNMGQYTTPEETVQYMTHKLLTFLPDQKEDIKILDPATGDGIFIHSLLKEGVPPEQLFAYDLDENVMPPDARINFFHNDFLKIDQTEKFDAIIGNPPYKSKRQSSYFFENARMIQTTFGTIGIHNLYSLFVHKGIQCLKPGGVLSMIIQDSFLTNVYYRNFRKYLLTETEIKEISLAPRRLFHKGKADVRTAILTIKKKNDIKPTKSQMRLIDRLENQNYDRPPKERIQHLEQGIFERLPGYNFAINVPEEILQHFKMPYKSIGDVLKGGTGISTGNDRHFLRTYDEIDSNDWIPFYKNGGVKDAWYYEPKYYIHKDWHLHAKNHPGFTIRNRAFFYERGITCSSMGVDFSAAYLPAKALFGVNANLFAENDDDLFYFLGLLNSKLVKYMIRKVLNRTNMITSGYIKKIPYIPPNALQKQTIIDAASTLVEGKKANSSFPVDNFQKTIDDTIYEVYGISLPYQVHVEDFCQNILEKI